MPGKQQASCCKGQMLQTSQPCQACHRTDVVKSLFTAIAIALLAEVLAAVTVQGTVFEHEQQVLQRVQQQLGKQNIYLDVLRGKASPANLHLKFHRVQQRLPADEVEALIALTKGDLPSLPAQSPGSIVPMPDTRL